MMDVIIITLLYTFGIGSLGWGLINILDAVNFVDSKAAEELKSFGVKCVSIGCIVIVIASFLNYFI